MRSEIEMTINEDPLYGEAIKIVRTRKQASISHIQRALKIGYNRAARMLEAMEFEGIITPFKSNGTRDVIKQP